MTFLANPKLILMRNNMIARQDDMPNANFEYASNPTVTTNPLKVNMSWLNTLTGEIFVCTDNTVDNNVWTGQLGTNVPDYGLNTNLLVSYSFDETSGSAVDDSANGFDATVIGSVTRSVAGKVGTAYHSSDWSDLNSVYKTGVGNLGAQAVSLAAWVKIAAPPTNNYTPTVIAYGSRTTLARVCLVCSQNNGYALLQQYDGSASSDLDSGVLIADGTWHHVVVTTNGTAIEIFVDGVSVASTTATARSITGSDITIGSIGSASGDALVEGVIDQPSVWLGRALVLADVQALYNSGNGLPYIKFGS
jgi:hypothetical protein